MAIWQGSPFLVTAGIVCYILFACIHDINNAYSTGNVSSSFLSCSSAGAGEMASNYDESEISSPGARPRPGEMGSNERRQSRQEIAWGQ